MGKTATLANNQDAQYKAQAQGYLNQARRILRQLATERQREARHRTARPSLVSEIKAILQGA